AWQSEAIISIGITSAQGVHTCLNKRKSTIPHIFTCIQDPVILGISEGKYFTGSNSTGIAENTVGALDIFTNALIHLRPDIKKMVVFHSNTPLLAERTAELANLLCKKNIKTESVTTSSATEIREFARTKISSDTDVVLLLRDGNMLNNLQEIAKKCRIEGVSCVTSDSKSVTEGAVAAICVEEKEIAILTAKAITRILKTGISAGSIPITYFNTASLYRIYINRHEMNAQGMNNRDIADLLSGNPKVEFVR
ncbi:MAG: transporter substrate-binding protein, partial [Candidatus Dependentiae bacterium]|nr:transporter substrate-binding protein [Candidatus Dependentiae bacterium]